MWMVQRSNLGLVQLTMESGNGEKVTTKLYILLEPVLNQSFKYTVDDIANAKEAWDIIKNQFQRGSLMQENSASKAILSTGVSAWRGYTYKY